MPRALKNKDNTLPLGDNYHHIAVIGPNANAANYVSTHYGPSDYKASSAFIKD
ncbi:MAG: glycoside hydrolase family 3 C-terminal domain-containing protein [Prevotella sp.]|nr:glycoside hydrolase family 3 C-terminal domain-containing protein [Prevotella sp.]